MLAGKPHWLARLTSPGGVFVLALLAALLMMFLPARIVDVAKSALADAIAPGGRLALSVRRGGQRIETLVVSHFHTSGRLAKVENELERLDDENRRLRERLAAARAAVGLSSLAADEKDGPSGGDAESLLRAKCIPARVLGHQAKSYLARIGLLEVGSASGVGPGSLVVESIDHSDLLLDRGEDTHLEPGRLVLAGRRVLGKVGRVGRHTCTLQTVTSLGYHDLVMLTGPDGKRLGPEGILEGTGGPLARLQFVETIEPVAEGDLVWSISAKGILPTPMLSGRVVRAGQPPGATLWEAEVQPAIDMRRVERVLILQAEVNPQRAAGSGQ